MSSKPHYTDSDSTSDSDSDSSSEIQSEVKAPQAQYDMEEVEEACPRAPDPEVMRHDIEDLKSQIHFMKEELEMKNRRIIYYDQELVRLHQRISMLSSSTDISKYIPRRVNYRTMYACGVCRRKPKATACICVKKKRKRESDSLQ